MAGYIANGNESLNTYGSLFANLGTSTELATIYPYDSGNDTELGNRLNFKTNYLETRYGDAIIETGTLSSTASAWQSDNTSFPYDSSPFFMRGGTYGNGTKAGIFAFFYSMNKSDNITYRAVLIP